VAVFTVLRIDDDARAARRAMVPFLDRLVSGPDVVLDRHPHAAEIRERHRHGPEALVDMPAAMWREIGAIGTLDDAVDHVEALHDAGADHVSLFPTADLDTMRRQLDDVRRVRTALARPT
jgi:alkanesulfonate monooxygenase SsuD/methylene tetrahydromethanopterin reductase-like flavin-dependent oxidoreductase (luciferase family)